MLPYSITSVLNSGSVNLTKISLVPLTEQEVVEYIAVTLYRPSEYVVPLAMVCLGRTNG